MLKIKKIETIILILMQMGNNAGVFNSRKIIILLYDDHVNSRETLTFTVS